MRKKEKRNHSFIKKLLLILLCLPVIGFGQKNIEIGFLFGGVSNKTIPNIAPSTEILNKFTHNRSEKDNLTLSYALTSKYRLSEKFSLNSKLIFHSNKVETTTIANFELLTFGDLIEGIPYLPTNYGLSMQQISELSFEEILRNETYHYLSLPLLLQFDFSINNSSVYVNSGCSFDYLTKIEQTSMTFFYPAVASDEISLENFNRLNLSVILGIGFSHLVSKKIKLSFEASTNLGLGNINKASSLGLRNQMSKSNIEELYENYNLYYGFSNTNSFSNILVGCSYLLSKE